MPTRKAEAQWNGSLRDGKGTMKLGSGAFEGGYSFTTRFEEAPGTNPEELIGAAHAGCFSMALAAALGRAGHNPTRIHTKADVIFERVGELPTITRIDLDTEAEVPGISDEDFQRIANDAKANCVVSRALAGVGTITLNAKLL